MWLRSMAVNPRGMSRSCCFRCGGSISCIHSMFVILAGSGEAGGVDCG
jgi:hypothetical protein